VFHPIFIPSMATVGYFLVTPRMYEFNFKVDVSITIAIFTVFIPILTFILLRRLRMIDTVFVKDVRQRKIPLYLYVLLLFLIVTKIISKSIFAELYDFFVATLISAILCLFFVLIRIKASMHMMGIAGLVMFLIVLSISYQLNITFALSILILMIGIVGSSRLYLKAHTISELILGFAIGVIPQLLVMYDWL
jgi:membrane-associated phospholipid phosphatase